MNYVGQSIGEGGRGIFPVSLGPDFVGFNDHSLGDVC